MKKLIFTALVALLSGLSILAQDTQIFQGYNSTIGGFNFSYHTPVKDYGPCLLSRAQADYKAIVWETEKIPADYDKSEVTFLWAYGMDVTSDSRNFDVYVNDEKYFTISNPLSNALKTWVVTGKNGARLTFNVTMIDKHKDQMGFASLTLPRSSIIPGKAVTLKVDAEKATSNSWYMIFTEELNEEFSAGQKDLLAKQDRGLYYVIGIDYINIGEKSEGEIRVMDRSKRIEILPGSNSYEIYIPSTLSTRECTVHLKSGQDKDLSESIEIGPVKEWTVYMVQHTHTDIGYTRPQTEILPEHLRYIDYALDFCDQTDDYPDYAKFRWTCETSWPVREYLKSRPQEQIDRLIKRVKEGRIELTGMFINYGEIVDEASLAAQLQPIGDFRKAGIEVNTLMQNDVNGIGWALADYAQNTGIRYVSMGQHGHRARIPFHKPTAFWWESPSGKRLLAYRSEHYMHGNTLGLTSGDLAVFRKGLVNYLEELDAKEYPFSHLAIQYSGYVTDNAPPSTIACEVVKKWNETYQWPRVKLAIASEFLSYLEENHSEELPVLQVAWPDWWTDGFGSAMRETQAVRSAHMDLIANTGLLSMSELLGAVPPQDIHHDISAVHDALLFYDEHTFGAAESISDPFSENSMIQWGEKASYAWNAVLKSRMLKEKAMGYVLPFFPKTDVPSLVVFNTLNWVRSGLVRIYIDHEIIPPGMAFRISDGNNDEISAQPLESRSDGTYWGLWVEDIPAMGYKSYRIEVGGESRKALPESPADNDFSNQYYEIRFNRSSGNITGIFDKVLQVELTDAEANIKAGQFIYEQLSNRHQMERFTSNKADTVYVPLEGSRKFLENVKVIDQQDGPIWKSMHLHGEVAGCADERGIDIEIRLYHKEKRIEFYYSMFKLPVTTPEAVYIAFPFHLPGGRLFYEAQGGIVEPGVNQLEGTSSDWNTIQNFISVRNENSQIVFGSNDAPLVQFGDINTGRFYYSHRPRTSHIYSWVLNNYWTTNFRASQQGELRWSYYITSGNDVSNTFATRFGWGSRVPFLTRVIPGGSNERPLKEESLLHINEQNVLLVSSMPAKDGEGIILQLRETEGQKASVDLTKLVNGKPAGRSTLVNVLGEKLRDLEGKLELMPFEAVFLKVEI